MSWYEFSVCWWRHTYETNWLHDLPTHSTEDNEINGTGPL
jgi:hypothetical protein